MTDDGLETKFQHQVVLRAKRNTPIRLCTGEWLCDVDIHFTLYPVSVVPANGLENLGSKTLGFLCCISTNNNKHEPQLVHGAAFVRENVSLSALLDASVCWELQLELEGINSTYDENNPYVLGLNRDKAVKIASYRLVGFQKED